MLDVVDLVDDLADLPDRLDRALGVGLDRLDLPADVLGGLGRLLGQLLDLVGDDREALARLAGAGRLDRGVEGQQVGLLGDRGDHLDHVADLGARLAELGDGGVGRVGDLDGLLGDLGRLVGVLGDLPDAGAHLLDAGGDGLHVLAHLLGGGRDDVGLGGRLLGVGAHLWLTAVSSSAEPPRLVALLATASITTRSCFALPHLRRSRRWRT